jgi:hypothetical protein
MKKLMFGFFVLLFSIATVSGAVAQTVWDRDVLITGASGDQLQIQTISDGMGGAYISWWDRLRYRVQLQRIDILGRKYWTRSVGVIPFQGGIFNSAMIRDGANGVIVAWAGNGSGSGGYSSINAQRINPIGHREWGSYGKAVTRADGNQGLSGIAIASDGQGGAFITWEDARPPHCCKVYAQHIDKNGNVLWPAEGIRVSAEPTNVFGPLPSPPRAIEDGAGGVIIAWGDFQNLRGRLFVQRLNSTGKALWRTDGIFAGKLGYSYFSMASDGAGGALLAHAAPLELGGFPNIFVQRVGHGGRLLWGENGALAGTKTYYASNPEVVSDSNGGAIVVWLDHLLTAVYEESNILAQHLGPGGERLWRASGKVLVNLPGQQDGPRIIKAGKNATYVVWRDCRDYVEAGCPIGADIYGQKIYNNGSIKWLYQGIPLAKTRGSQALPQGTPSGQSFIDLASDLHGGAIMAWPDGRRDICGNSIFESNCDVFSQRISDHVAPQ